MRHHPATAAVHALLVTACLVPLLHAREPSYRFPEKLPDGALAPAPPPAEPAPGLGISRADVLHSRTHSRDGRDIVVRTVRPFDLPPLPEPPASRDAAASRPAPLPRSSAQKTCFLHLDAAVHTSSAFPGQTRTLLRVWNQRTGKSFRAWSTAPWHHLAGALSSFEGPEGRYLVTVICHPLDHDRIREARERRGIAWTPPEIPPFPPDDRSSFSPLPGENPPPADLDPLQAIHRWCADPAVREKLRLAWEGRERAKEEAAARPAGTPEKKDIILSTWRTGGAELSTPAGQ